MDMVHTRNRLIPVAGVLVDAEDPAQRLQFIRNVSSSRDVATLPLT